MVLLIQKYDEFGLLKIKSRNNLSDLQLYILDTSNLTNNITHTLESLALINKYLLRFHTVFNTTLNLNKLDENDAVEIQYHIENYYIRVTKVKDQILLLLNHLFELQLKNNECTYSKVYNSLKKSIIHKSAERINATEIIILQYIDKYKKSFKQIDNYRNYITHRGEYLDDDLHLVKSVLYFRDLEKTKEYPKRIFKGGMPNSELENFLKRAVIKKVIEFRETNNIVNDWTFQIFKLLDKTFEIKIKEKMPNR